MLITLQSTDSQWNMDEELLWMSRLTFDAWTTKLKTSFKRLCTKRLMDVEKANPVWQNQGKCVLFSVCLTEILVCVHTWLTHDASIRELHEAQTMMLPTYVDCRVVKNLNFTQNDDVISAMTSTKMKYNRENTRQAHSKIPSRVKVSKQAKPEDNLLTKVTWLRTYTEWKYFLSSVVSG